MVKSHERTKRSKVGQGKRLLGSQGDMFRPLLKCCRPAVASPSCIKSTSGAQMLHDTEYLTPQSVITQVVHRRLEMERRRGVHVGTWAQVVAGNLSRAILVSCATRATFNGIYYASRIYRACNLMYLLHPYCAWQDSKHCKS
jgi:hypothetical protein